MIRVALITVCLLGSSTMVSAQEGGLPRGLGYVFVAPGFIAGDGTPGGTVQSGVGGEFRIYKGLAVGAELSGVGAIGESFDDVGLFSLNGYYHLPNASRSTKVIPFITAGYTGAGVEPWFNVGGGADYWFKNRLGLRVEFRDQIDANHSNPMHYAGMRVGLVWH